MEEYMDVADMEWMLCATEIAVKLTRVTLYCDIDYCIWVVDCCMAIDQYCMSMPTWKVGDAHAPLWCDSSTIVGPTWFGGSVLPSVLVGYLHPK